MKRLISTLFFSFCLLAMTQAQLVINEIMFNSPDGGADSIEFIELYNPAATALDISGWSFTQGVTHTFESGTMVPAEGYVVVAVDAQAMMDAFGITAIQWENGGLSNGGEDIEIVDAASNVIDYVDYESSSPWPTEAAGNGASAELCGASADNSMGENWFAGSTATGVILDGVEVLATPGAANTAVCPGPDATVEVSSNVFTPADITIMQGQTVEWVNLGGFHNVNGTQATFPNNPESFTNGGASNTSWTFTYTFNVPGVYDYQCDPHAGFGMAGTVTVIAVDQYPERNIGAVTTVNAEGVIDSADVKCELTGIVYGVNMNGGGLAFTLIDENNAMDGISVYSQNDNFGYTVTEGDKVTVEGTIGQFRGLQQIYADNVITISSGNNIFDPTLTTTLGEAEESVLIRMNNLTLDSINGSNAFVSNGTDQFIMRIDSDTDIDINTIPANFDAIGIGGQFDFDAPYDEGYQFFPRYTADIIAITSTYDETLANDISILPNPTSKELFIQSDLMIDHILVTNNLGQQMASFRSIPTNGINVSAYAKGIYQVTFVVEDRTWTTRFVKQ